MKQVISDMNGTQISTQRARRADLRVRSGWPTESARFSTLHEASMLALVRALPEAMSRFGKAESLLLAERCGLGGPRSGSRFFFEWVKRLSVYSFHSFRENGPRLICESAKP